VATLTTDNGLAKALSALKNDGVICYPTETVYGIGADIYSEKAVAKLYQIKGRSKAKPVSVMIGNKACLNDLCAEISDDAKALMDAFWPGPLTIIFKANKFLPGFMISAENTIGIRFPDHHWSIQLTTALGHPITSTSANLSGRSPASTFGELEEELLDCVDYAYDGGACNGIASTVVNLSMDEPQILREGIIHSKQVWNALKKGKNV